jgi:hypothetical protein
MPEKGATPRWHAEQEQLLFAIVSDSGPIGGDNDGRLVFFKDAG